MKSNSTKELATGAPNDTTPEQRTPKKQSCRLWWGAADQCTMWHGTYIHNKM